MESEIPLRQITLPERDVQRVAQELDLSPESTSEQPLPSKEAVRQALVAVLPKPAAAVTDGAATVSTTDVMAQERVAALVQMAVDKGIDAAHTAAQNDEPFVLDALHDALAGALYEQLHTRGQL